MAGQRESRKESGEAGGRGGASRVAASSYLNTAPLIWSFARGPRRGEVELLTDTAPARCADMLARGQVEAALVPVVEYQRLPETAIVPGVCVGARREVQSVVLVTRGAPLEEVRSVALDTSSRCGWRTGTQPRGCSKLIARARATRGWHASRRSRLSASGSWGGRARNSSATCARTSASSL
ncbi:MAG: hypothetical protein DMF66_04945, partial [Acidobacteria bacterium]